MKEKESIGRLVSILHRWAQVYFQKELDSLGLSHGQLKIVMYLGRFEGATQQELSKYFHLDKGTTSFLIKKMYKAGYVRKEKNPADKRSHNLYLTVKTIAKYKRLREISMGWTDILLKDFSEEKRSQAFDLLNEMINNVNDFRDGQPNAE